MAYITAFDAEESSKGRNKDGFTKCMMPTEIMKIARTHFIAALIRDISITFVYCEASRRGDVTLFRVCLFRDSRRMQGNAEADVVVAVRWGIPEPVRRPTKRGIAKPTAATEQAE